MKKFITLIASNLPEDHPLLRTPVLKQTYYTKGQLKVHFIWSHDRYLTAIVENVVNNGQWVKDPPTARCKILNAQFKEKYIDPCDDTENKKELLSTIGIV